MLYIFTSDFISRNFYGFLSTLKKMIDITGFMLAFKILNIKQENLLTFLILIYCLLPYLVVSSILNGNISILLMNIPLLHIIIKISCLIIITSAFYLYGFVYVFNIFHHLLEIVLTWLIIAVFIIFNIWFIIFDFNVDSLFLITNGILSTIKDLRWFILGSIVFYSIFINNYKFLFNIFLRISITILCTFLIFIISYEILNLLDIIFNSFVFMMASGSSGSGSGGDPNGNPNGNPNKGPNHDPYLPDKDSKGEKYSNLVSYFRTEENSRLNQLEENIRLIVGRRIGHYDDNMLNRLEVILPNLPREDMIRIFDHERDQWTLISISAQQIPFDGTIARHPYSPLHATIVPSRITQVLETDYADTIRIHTIRNLHNSHIQGRAPERLENYHDEFLRAFRRDSFNLPR